MTTLVVGGSGFVGGELVATLRRAGEHVVATRHETPATHTSVEFDFWHDDPGPLLDNHDIDRVVFAATVEHGYDESLAGFERAVGRLLDACEDRRFVYCSSDSVFEGTDGPYVEDETRNPTTDYGRRLVAFEDAIRDGHDDFCIVRPGYVFGVSRGDLDPRLTDTRERLRRGETVEFFDDMYKSPVAVSELATAVANLAAGDYTGVVHAGGPRTSVYRFQCNGMDGLGVDSDAIVPTTIPEDLDVPPDLSIDSGRLTGLTGVELSSVRAAFVSES